MKRREFLVGTSATLLTLKLAAVQASGWNFDGERINLWRGTPPGGGGPSGKEVLTDKGALSNVAVPHLQVFRPAQPSGKAVIVASGGGYKRMEMGTEAIPAAKWLVDRGYTAYVLVYRLPLEGWRSGSIVSLQDAQRALRIVRSLEKHVTLLGFSAGGHLLGMTATIGGVQTYEPTDSIDAIPTVASGAALIYPVITLESPYTHTSTHKVLVGPRATSEEEASWSVQTRVSHRTPPMFLVQAEDDPISDPNNTLIMSAACEAKHVPVEMHRYATGGHGFGLGRPGTPTMEWPARYEPWLHGLNLG
ncbi:alpha/beta hydrolase [Pseudomonas sp. MWU16-30317]|uniref:alpha/beta hydrolase n=1 Tax=Pseudomonas sp. MWU16-30317 TaxID=2878095 RepID=UPI001CF997BA|nr:alpha/beta hydrolase [Pseudomonas sp. MWU16-30317]